MNLAAKRITYQGSFDPIDGWYIGIGEHTKIAQVLHIAILEQEEWMTEFDNLKLNPQNLIIKKFNVKCMYNVFLFENEQIAIEAAEWLESMLVMGKML